MEKIYVIGHINPDTDTVVSALSLSRLLNLKESTDRYVPVMTGKANAETEFVFKKFNIELPDIMQDASGKKLFLVDHNEATQIINGGSTQNVVGFIDHHKVNFECPGPIFMLVKPWGSTCSVIYDMFKKDKIKIPQELKPLMLSAILSDTVILKSPTTTPMDVSIVNALADELSINFEEFGMELFKAKAQIALKTALDIIKNDFKNFDYSGKKVGIGQVETPDLSEIEVKYDEIKSELKSLKDKEKYHSLVLMLTDIIKEGSVLMVVSDDDNKIANIFNTKIGNNLTEFLPGIMSRKKQVAKLLAEKL